MISPEIAEAIEVASLRAYLLDRLPGLDSPDLEISWLSGGQSNLTFLMATPAGRYVLRRPPMGPLLPKAHDVLREARIIAALDRSAVPVPAVLATCDDVGVIGAPFYVMNYVPGAILRSPRDAESITSAQAAACSAAMIQSLADLHRVDYAELGLAQIGRPDGFLERQLHRWRDQWARCETDQVVEVDALADALQRRLPRAQGSSLVHGDFRIENIVLDLDGMPSDASGEGRQSMPTASDGGSEMVQAVLDWELAALGDPLTDVGWLAMYWAEPDDRPIFDSQATTQRDGFWSRARLFEEYQRRTGTAVDDLGFYVALAHYKLAVIQQGIHLRFLRGDASGERAAGSGGRVRSLAEAGLEAVAQPT